MLIGIVPIHAQRMKMESGSVNVLSDQKNVNIVYDYSDFGVGKFATEREYLDKKSSEYNAKEAGRGDKWLQDWVSDRKNRFEPKFEELLNKGLSKRDLVAVENRPDAKYTLIIRTKFVEPGFNVGVVRKNASVDFQIDLVASENKTNILAKMELSKVPGGQFGGYDFDTGTRIAESYAKGGKMLAAFLMKELK